MTILGMAFVKTTTHLCPRVYVSSCFLAIYKVLETLQKYSSGNDHISPLKFAGKTMFLFHRWDMDSFAGSVSSSGWW